MPIPGAGFRRLITAGAVAACVLMTAPIARPAYSHEAKCPVCKLDVPQDTEQQDNEVAIRSGRKRLEYRCAYCALNDAKSFNGDVTVLAPSEIKGRPVLLSRTDGKWSAMPETTVFAARKVNHRECQIAYRAFSTPSAFEAYAKKHQDVLGAGAKSLTLAQMLEAAK